MEVDPEERAKWMDPRDQSREAAKKAHYEGYAMKPHVERAMAIESIAQEVPGAESQPLLEDAAKAERQAGDSAASEVGQAYDEAKAAQEHAKEAQDRLDSL